ncbi:MAG: alpha/beta hydrolase [Hyphomonadaceae bacterium]|nr:alpha/beta hydrolase [Hyphomonadaceae bacterium]
MVRGIIGALLALVGLVAVLAGGAYLMLRRADVPYETLAAQYESAASRYAELPGGVRVHYRDEGQPNGPVLVLIHGFSASVHTWEPWVARLGDEYRIISLDLPGHGLTRAPAGYQASIEAFRDVVHTFLQAQGVTNFAIAGNSMGGNVAWEYALAYPEDVNALILVDASGWEDTRLEASEEPTIFKLLRNPMLGPVMRDLDNTRLVHDGLEAAFVNTALVDDAMVNRYVQLSRAPGHREILLQMTLGFRERHYATAERLAALQMPVLIMAGDTDRIVPTEHAQHFHDAIPGSQLVIFPSTGHVPQEERPEESATAANEFLYRVIEGSALAPLPEVNCDVDARC